MIWINRHGFSELLRGKDYCRETRAGKKRIYAQIGE